MSIAVARFESPLPGQIAGYWVPPWEAVSPEPPAYDATGAVLRRAGETAPDAFLCLDLVRIEDVWYPLSEAGIYTYAHSSGLVAGEAWRFVTYPAGAPVEYEATPAEPLTAAEVAEQYGREAADRCRPNRAAVQIELRRVDRP